MQNRRIENRHPVRDALLGLCFLLPAPGALAATDDDRIAALERQLKAQESRILDLERQLAARPVVAAPPAAPALAAPLSTASTPVTPAVASAPVAVAAAPPAPKSPLTISGDLRLREELNGSDPDARDRWRTVLRARLRANYALSDSLMLGAQLATGDADDPNSTDVTLSNFADDLDVSLDQVYARLVLGDLTLYGGKFPQPFRRTELVWDGDVSPQGVAAAYGLPLGEGARLDARGVYFAVDESVAGKDSSMLGGQLGLTLTPAPDWRVELVGSYYDYRLRSLAGADSGDIRSNLVGLDGRYLSDFDLVEGMLIAGYAGFGARWPVTFTGDFVRNLGAATPEDTGYSAELAVGRASTPGDLRFTYGYSVAEVDSVLAAFSNDNLNFGTNYRLHSFAVDYVPWPHVVLNATYYAYRADDPFYSAASRPENWLSRMRLNVLWSF